MMKAKGFRACTNGLCGLRIHCNALGKCAILHSLSMNPPFSLALGVVNDHLPLIPHYVVPEQTSSSLKNVHFFLTRRNRAYPFYLGVNVHFSLNRINRAYPSFMGVSELTVGRYPALPFWLRKEHCPRGSSGYPHLHHHQGKWQLRC